MYRPPTFRSSLLVHSFKRPPSDWYPLGRARDLIGSDTARKSLAPISVLTDGEILVIIYSFLQGLEEASDMTSDMKPCAGCEVLSKVGHS